MRSFVALFMVVAGTLVVAVAPAGAAAAVPRLRVMPLGDSITWGTGSSNGSGYRGPLWSELVRDGFGAGLDFVGSQSAGAMPDPDNEGHPGWWINGIQGIISPLAAKYRPNVVALHIGTNDMINNGDVANAPARLGALIDQVVAAAPDATVLVAQIVPSGDATVEPRTAAYNAAIPGIVQARANAGKHVRLVSMSAVLPGDLVDGIHPGDAGYQKMADAWDAAIRWAVSDGWVANPVPTGICPGAVRWTDRGQIATGVGSTLAHIQFADINGDRRDDYLVVADDTAVTEWQNTGTGWTGKGQIATGAGADLAHLRWADIDGDHRDDYLVMSDAGAINEWQNTGSGWIARGQIATGTGSDLAHVRLTDIDGDGRDDYLVMGDNGSVTEWQNTGTGWTGKGQIATGTGSDPAHERFADINGDGRADYLVVGDNGSVTQWQNNGGDGAGGWTAKGQIASGASDLAHVRFADIDGDGRADYLVMGDNGSVHEFHNDCA